VGSLPQTEHCFYPESSGSCWRGRCCSGYGPWTAA